MLRTAFPNLELFFNEIVDGESGLSLGCNVDHQANYKIVDVKVLSHEV